MGSTCSLETYLSIDVLDRLALLLAIIYLASQAFPIIFQEQHGFTPGMLGLAFIGLDIGFVIAMATQPLWNRYQAKLAARYKSNPPPEMWLKMGQVGGILTPIGELLPCYLKYSKFEQFHRTLHHGVHYIQRCSLDRANHRIDTFRHRRLLRLHFHVHIFCNCIFTNDIRRNVRQCHSSCDSCWLLPTVCKCHVPQAWYGWCNCPISWPHHCDGTFTVCLIPPLECLVFQYL